MPSAMLTYRAPLVTPLERAPDAPAVAAPAPSEPLPPEAPALLAHRAVDAVLSAIERFSTGDRHAVQMHFSIGGSDLAVRVELRSGEVRTTFRTDSPELRTALAHEWQAASASSTDRPLRLLPPVFSPHDRTGFSASAGDTASGQRDARARPEISESFSPKASRLTPAFASVADDQPVDAARAAVPSTVRHLSTIA